MLWHWGVIDCFKIKIIWSSARISNIHWNSQCWETNKHFLKDIIFCKIDHTLAKNPIFQSGQSSLTPPILIHWWWTMGRWNPNIKENLFQVFNRKQGQFQQIIICPPQTNSTHDNKCAKYFQEFFVTYIFKHLSTYLPWLVFLNNQKKFKIWLVRQCVQDLKDVLVFWINCFLKYNNMNTPDVGYPGITNFLVECRRWYNRAKDIRH